MSSLPPTQRGGAGAGGSPPAGRILLSPRQAGDGDGRTLVGAVVGGTGVCAVGV